MSLAPSISAGKGRACLEAEDKNGSREDSELPPLNDKCCSLHALNKTRVWLNPMRFEISETQTSKELDKIVLEQAPETASTRFLSFRGKPSDTCVSLCKCLFNLFLALLKCSSGAHARARVLLLTPVSCGLGKSTKYCKRAVNTSLFA